MCIRDRHKAEHEALKKKVGRLREDLVQGRALLTVDIMDFLQLVFGFVNAPLFATFLLGMFWKRATGHGAFVGLLSGTTAAALTHGLTVAEGKGGWIANMHDFPSQMAQNFWIAIFAWTTCFLVTIVVSLITTAPPESQLRGLVYGFTDLPRDCLLYTSRCV